MKKILIWTASILVVIFLLGRLVFLPMMISSTKKHSPAETVKLTSQNTEFEVNYSRPYKKGRTIFGELVPFNEVWRTGANEPTTFTITKDVKIDNQDLPAGKYTLWTIPGSQNWEVIFNKKMYSWGVTFGQKSPREESEDALIVKVPIQNLDQTVEQFTIELNQKEMGSDSIPLPPIVEMTLSWDETKVSVPINL